MSKNYWIDRGREREKAQDKKVDEIFKEMSDNYHIAKLEIEKNINNLVAKYMDTTELSYSEATKRLNSTDLRAWKGTVKEYEEAISKLSLIDEEAAKKLRIEFESLATKSQITRLESLNTQIDIALINKSGMDETSLTNGVKDTYNDTSKYMSRNLNVASVLSEKQVEDLIKVPWSGANYSERIWNNRDTLAKVLKQELVQGFIQGINVREMSQRISKRLGQDLSNSERLIRTEITYANNQASKLSYEEAGITEYEYLAETGERTCKICKPLNGKVFSIEEMEVGKNYPPIHPRCRCSTIPVVDYDNIGKKKEPPKEPKPTKEKLEFIPAKTIEEAIQYAEKFVDKGFSITGKNLNYESISLDNANEINKALTKVFEETKLKKFSSIEVFTKKNKKYYSQHSDAPFVTSNMGNFMINGDILKNTKTIEKYMSDSDKAFDYVIDNMNKLTGSKLELAKLYKEAGRSLVGNTLEDMVIHETGHHLSYMKEINSKLADLQKNTDWEKYAKKLSGYANHSFGEYVAESWNGYLKEGIELQPEIKDIFETVKIKNRLTDIKKSDTIKEKVIKYTDEERKKSILDYTGVEYSINNYLRKGLPLDNAQKGFVAVLDEALEERPVFKGQVKRSLEFYEEEEIVKFLSEHEKGKTVKYKDFVSTTKGDNLFEPDGQVQLVIKSKTGRDIIELSEFPEEEEILFPRNTKFKVLSVKEEEGTYHIEMEELDEE